MASSGHISYELSIIRPTLRNQLHSDYKSTLLLDSNYLISTSWQMTHLFATVVMALSSATMLSKLDVHLKNYLERLHHYSFAGLKLSVLSTIVTFSILLSLR